jgi:hypothetical protein
MYRPTLRRCGTWRVSSTLRRFTDPIYVQYKTKRILGNFGSAIGLKIEIWNWKSSNVWFTKKTGLCRLFKLHLWGGSSGSEDENRLNGMSVRGEGLIEFQYLMEDDGMALSLEFLVRIYGNEVRSIACAWQRGQDSGGLKHPGADAFGKDDKGLWCRWRLAINQVRC